MRPSFGAVSSCLGLCIFASIFLQTYAQHMAHLQDVHHPPAAQDFGGHEFAREILSSDTNSITKEIDVVHILPADTLIDPDGKAVIDVRLHKARIKKEKDEEARLFAEITRKTNVGVSELRWAWIGTLFGCLCIVGCGVLPAFIVPINGDRFLDSIDGRHRLNILLSFAVGSLLGDVFLHLLPETWASNPGQMLKLGMWTVGGLLLCLVIEKSCASTEGSQRRICALINLAANVVDNFTHGLAVGGSFLVGLRQIHHCLS
ncbi:hypothetical protein AB6A40_004001 [Gnathostoma spinigerum]|uniref:Uncharacterized protein n=1 Tax=Gnathostoma spinigerum TaxID=75299 RepID=A0ABD6EDE4_9BILA